MKSAIRDFWTIFLHELTACRRNWRTVLFALGVPVLVMLVGLCVGLNGRDGEKRLPRVSIDSPMPVSDARKRFIAALKESPYLQVVPGNDPLAELRDGKVDAVFSFPDHDASLVIALNPQSLGEKGTFKIERAVNSARDRTFSLNPALKDKPAQFLNVFEIKADALTQSSAYLVEVVMVFVSLFLYRIGDSVSFAAQTIWLAEPRAKSLLNLLVLPVNRYALAAAKCMAMIILSLGSVIAYQFGFILAVLLMAIAAPRAQDSTDSSSSALAEAFGNVSQLGWLPFSELLVIVFFMFALVCASISLIVIATLKEKQVGAVLGWVLTASLIPILLIFHPATELNAVTQFIPLLNMVALLKAALLKTMHWYQPWLVLMEMTLITGLLLSFGIRLIGRERFLLNSLE